MNLKNKLSQLFNNNKPKRIIFTFIEDGKGRVHSSVKFDKSIPVGFAASSLDRLKTEISAGMAVRVTEAGYTPKNPKRRQFISRQTLGDILK